MTTFADRLLAAIEEKGNPSVLGLDPRVESMPEFALSVARRAVDADGIRGAIGTFHEAVIEAAADLVPAVKIQIAFYEQYGLAGMQAFADTIATARAAGLVVILDAKRNDIDSTAAAYARAFIGRPQLLGRPVEAFGGDGVTVSPFLGRDSLEPFVAECAANGTGIFVLVKTSNAGSGDIQNVETPDGGTVSDRLARMVDELGQQVTGESGYSSIGAVVGATYPEEATRLRELMPRAIILVPGYGAQGGTADGAARSFNADGRGGIVNASRSITYPKGADAGVPREDFCAGVRDRIQAMAADLNGALARRAAAP